MCLCTCAGCSIGRWHKPAKPAAAAAPVHNMVGTIVSVNETGNYVLIDTGGVVTATKGTALKCFEGEQQTAILTVSPEQRPPFMIADIVQGTPKNGDRVMQ